MDEFDEFHKNDGDVGSAGADIVSVPSDVLTKPDIPQPLPAAGDTPEQPIPAVRLDKPAEEISEQPIPAVRLDKPVEEIPEQPIPAVRLDKPSEEIPERPIPAVRLDKPAEEIPEQPMPAVQLKKSEETVPENGISAEGGSEAVLENTDMSLEGRRVQLEEKVRGAAFPQQPASTVYVPAAAVPQTASRPSPSAVGAKGYIAMIAAILVIFLVGFIWECVRTYKSTGMFGGDLDRFVDTDYDPFGFFGGHNDDDDSDEASGLFPFSFPDSDKDGDSFALPDPDSSDTDISDADASYIKKAPDSDSVVDASSAVLKLKDQPDDIDTGEYTARYAFRQVKDSVVNVVVFSNADVIGETPYKLGTGTGIVITSNGYVITNSHVIEDKKGVGVEIILTDGRCYAATIVGYDTRTDLAVLKIDATGLSAAEFVDSSQIEVGQDAIAVGNPGGVEYSNSLTRGCVSALNRTVKSNTVVSYIQTDAAINPGNSGGPLLNSAGQIMGVTTIKIASTEYEGMGFAIPSDTVVEIANDIIAKGYVSGRVRLGITGKVYEGGILTDTYGIEIIEISSDSPLVGTEARVGDVIMSINGVETPDFASLFMQLASHEPGDEVTLGMYRPPSSGDAGKKYELKVKLIADEGATQHD